MRLQLLRDGFFRLVELYVKIFKTVSNLRETLSTPDAVLAYRAAKLTCLDPPGVDRKLPNIGRLSTNLSDFPAQLLERSLLGNAPYMDSKLNPGRMKLVENAL
jgi:hypothetical protein